MEAERNWENKMRWELEREMYFHKNGISGIEVKNLKEEGHEVVSTLTVRDIEIQRQMQCNKIQNSRYKRRYRELYTIGIPEYLKKHYQKVYQKIIARFRCENEELSNGFWREQDENICRLCHSETETLDHLAINCIVEIRNSTRVS